MKNLDAVMSYTGSAFLQKEIILSPFRVVMLMTAPCLPRDSPDEWIMRRSVTRIVSPSRPPTSASWFQIFICSMFKDVRANCFCASLLRTEIHIPRHASSVREVLKWTMIWQMAIAIALFGFNDLGRSVTPTFLFRNRFYLQLSPHCPKMNNKSMWEVKRIQDFCPRDMESCHLTAARRMKLWSLNTNLFLEDPH